MIRRRGHRWLPQERFEIQRLPEISYWRIGDGIFGDRLTFFSANTVSALKFDRSEEDLSELGFRRNTHPGLPAVGWTGDPVMNLPWTQAGLPTLCLPAGESAEGLPMGLQVAGRFGQDGSTTEYS